MLCESWVGCERLNRTLRACARAGRRRRNQQVAPERLVTATGTKKALARMWFIRWRHSARRLIAVTGGRAKKPLAAVRLAKGGRAQTALVLVWLMCWRR